MADRYWVGGTANWDATAGSKWATTSGGAGGASVPTSADNVFFDTNSGTATVTITATATCSSFDATNFGGTITGAQPLEVYAALTLDNATTWSHTGTVRFLATTGPHTITTRNKSFGALVFFNGVGASWLLGSDFTAIAGGTSGIRIDNGSFDANGYNVTAPLFRCNSSSTRSFLMRDGTFTATGASNVWLFETTTNLTFNAGTSTIKLTDSSATTKQFNGGGLTYYNIWLTGTGTGTFNFTGSNTFNDLKCDTPPHSILFTAGTTTTVSSFTVSGTAGNLMTIGSITSSNHTIAKAGEGTSESDYLSISRSTATPANTWYAGSNSTNGGNNSGWTFTAAPKSLTAAQAAFTLTGQTTLFALTRNLIAAAASYATTLASATLRYSNIWTRIAKNSTTWSNASASSTSWTNEPKSSTSWTNVPKS